MTMRIALSLLGALCLTACGEMPEPAPPSEDAPAQTPIPVEPDGGIGDGAVPLDEARTLADKQIPAKFHGVWDYVEGTCALESDLRMEISAGEILFYESIGMVRAVRPEGDDVMVTLAMEGEGEIWDEDYRLTLSDDGETLTPQFFYEGQTNDPMPRKKCAE